MDVWAKCIADIKHVVTRCDRSIDIVIDPALATVLAMDAAILEPISSLSISKRAILPTHFTSAPELSAITPTLRATARRHQGFFDRDWELRLGTWFPLGMVIADGERSLSVSMEASHEGGKPRHTLHDDREATASLAQHFDRLWQMAQPVDLIYDDLAYLGRRDAHLYVISVGNEISESLLDALRRDPTNLNQLTPRKFEILVAELLRRQGAEVQLTPQTRDGGFDIFARLSTPLGNALYLVECKKWSMKRPVNVSVVRTLYGVVEQSVATGGMIVTTSRFTSTAISAAQTLKHRISLADYEELRSWLRYPPSA